MQLAYFEYERQQSCHWENLIGDFCNLVYYRRYPRISSAMLPMLEFWRSYTPWNSKADRAGINRREIRSGYPRVLNFAPITNAPVNTNKRELQDKRAINYPEKWRRLYEQRGKVCVPLIMAAINEMFCRILRDVFNGTGEHGSSNLSRD